MGRRVIEIASSGYDEFLQGLGGDPYHGSYSMGLRVPAWPTPDPDHRYLFLLASFSMGEGESCIVRGYRQFASLGVALANSDPPRFFEKQITSPQFRLPDGNISWHLRHLGGPNAQGVPKEINVHEHITPERRDPQGVPVPHSHRIPERRDLWSFKQMWADGPALLYQDYSMGAPGSENATNRIYTQLNFYQPPNLGRPYGASIPVGHQPTFYDLKTPWRSALDWHALDMHVHGPSTIAFFASVHQSTGFYPVGAAQANYPLGLPPEEQFIASVDSGLPSNPQRPIYWRVGGALVVEVGTGAI